MKKKLRLWVSLVTVAALAAGCYYDNKEDLYPPASTTGGIPDPCDTVSAMTYTTQVKTILDSKCATSNCHNAQSLAGGVDLSVYTQAFNFRERIRQRALVTGDMPQLGSPALTSCEKMQLQKWLDTGAQQ